jgi:hypothetical protein
MNKEFKRAAVAMLAFLILLDPTIYSSQVAGPERLSSIQGVVSDAQSGQALRNARITIYGPTGEHSEVTDGSGKFAFGNVLAGRYRVTVAADGYLSTHQQFGPTILELATGEELKSISFRLLKLSAIMGRILDENDSPIAGLTVMAMKLEYRYGRRGLFPQQTLAVTGSNGEYRVFGLEPGEYYLSVRFNPGGPSGVPVYYPGTTDPNLALSVMVQAGRDVPVADLKLKPMEVHSVRVTILTPEQGTIPSLASWFVRNRDPESLVDFAFNAWFTRVGPNLYQSPALPPGAYELHLIAPLPSPRFGHLVFDIKDEDEDAGTIVVTSGATLTGRVRIAGQQGGDARSMRVSLTPVNGYPRVFAGGVTTEGTFVIRNVPEGNYWVVVDGVSQDSFVQTVHYGARPADGAEIVVAKEPEGPLEIVLATTGGRVTGTVVNALGERLPASHVVIFPSPSRKANPSLIKTAQADQNALFSISGLPPGEYRASAWGTLPNLSKDPKFLAQIAQYARVTVTEGSTTDVRVQVYPQPN